MRRSSARSAALAGALLARFSRDATVSPPAGYLTQDATMHVTVRARAGLIAGPGMLTVPLTDIVPPPPATGAFWRTSVTSACRQRGVPNKAPLPRKGEGLGRGLLYALELDDRD